MNTTPCTRCHFQRPIIFRGTFDAGLPYQLCSRCYDVYLKLEGADAARFAVELWQRSAVLHLAPEGHA
jgi:hypothetical protein